jgi:hypothetical protein
MMMPGKRTLKLDELDELAVQFTRNARVPVIAYERELVGEINLFHWKNVLQDLQDRRTTAT